MVDYLPGTTNPADILSKHEIYPDLSHASAAVILARRYCQSEPKATRVHQVQMYICLDNIHWNLSEKWRVSTFHKF